MCTCTPTSAFKFISTSALTEHVVQNTEHHGSTISTIGMTSSKAKVSNGLCVSILGKYFGIQNYYSMFCPLFDNFIIKKFEFWKCIQYFGWKKLEFYLELT